MSTPTERGLPFSGEMVRALLARTKTQTRRVISPKLLAKHDPTTAEGRTALLAACPYGRPGDRLYCREAVAFGFTDDWPLAVDYHADGRRQLFDELEVEDDPALGQASLGYINDQRRPSIFMPRWCARLVFDLIDVRVEQVSDISPEDALAEGVAADLETHAGQYWREEAVGEYQRLWDALNASRGYGWDARPWVYALTLREAERLDDARFL